MVVLMRITTIPANTLDDAAVQGVLRAIVKDHPANMRGEALSYMRAALSMSGHMLHVQVLYIINNLDNWRGVESKRIKQELRAYLKARCNKGCMICQL